MGSLASVCAEPEFGSIHENVQLATWGPQYKKNVMFLCDENSCKSQMAEGWLRRLRGDASIGVASAGIVVGSAVKKGAIKVMKEAGVDISSYTSNALADFEPEDFDVVISCCCCRKRLEGDCEVWKKRPLFQDWGLDDPEATHPGDLSVYHRVRDEVREKVEELLSTLSKPYGPHYTKNVMFLCNHNSCRSQMADGWLRELRGDASVGVASSGIVGGTAVKPGAITVMKEAGVDISSFTSDAMANFNPENFDAVISCCGCSGKLEGDSELWMKRPLFQDWGLDDPPAIDPGDLSAYRRVRDEVKAKVEELLSTLSKPYGPHYKRNVMFLCDKNSCQSQMADGWLRHLRGDASVGVASAGIVGGTAVTEGALIVMKEAGVDISSFTSDAMADFEPENFDVVISCCSCSGRLEGDGEDWKTRPLFQDWGLDDPSATDLGDLSAYRRVRDEVKAKVEDLLGTLSKTYGPQYRKNVMFLCDHNSSRSQVADAWLRMWRGRVSLGVASAGIVSGTAVKPGAIAVMREAGVDISSFTSDAMDDFKPEDFDVVISCCGCSGRLQGDSEAWMRRPFFQDWGLDDPPAIDPGDLSAYRRVRDEAKGKVKELIEAMQAADPTALFVPTTDDMIVCKG